MGRGRSIPGINNLATLRPDIAARWDYEKNGALKPKNVTVGSNKKVWWKCHLNHSWDATIAALIHQGNRAKGQGYPYCAHKKVCLGFNGLATVTPSLLDSWDYERNIYYAFAVIYRMLTEDFPPKNMKREDKEKALRNRRASKVKKYDSSLQRNYEPLHDGIQATLPNLPEGLIKAVCDGLELNEAGEPFSEKSYQSAEDALAAIRSFPNNDSRRRRMNWKLIQAFFMFLAPFLIGAFLSGTGARLANRTLQMEQQAYFAIETLEAANYTQAVSFALDATERQSLISPNDAPAAQSVLARVIGAYDYISGYKPLHVAPVLQGKPLEMILSPDGTFTAVMVKSRRGGLAIQIFDTESGKEYRSLSVNGGLRDFVIREDNLLIYASDNALRGCWLDDNYREWLPEGAPAFPPASLSLLTAKRRWRCIRTDSSSVSIPQEAKQSPIDWRVPTIPAQAHT